MRVNEYPPPILNKLLQLVRDLSESDEVSAVHISQDRPVDIVNGQTQIVGPNIITITIECHNEIK